MNNFLKLNDFSLKFNKNIIFIKKTVTFNSQGALSTLGDFLLKSFVKFYTLNINRPKILFLTAKKEEKLSHKIIPRMKS